MENKIYNPFSLEGKTILVTGASSGIGRATAIECSKLGARIILTGRSEERLQGTLGLLNGTEHLVFPFDLSKIEDLDLFVDKLPTLDGLVNNAGITITYPVQFIKADNLNEILSINTISPVLLTQKLLRKKRLLRNSSVVFTASISGIYCVIPGNAMYSITKAAINAFMKNAAVELAYKGIRFNCVCPGMVDTGILEAGVVTKEQLEIEKAKYPMKRFGNPHEVALGIVYFLSDSSFVTGSDLVMDGGFTLL